MISYHFIPGIKLPKGVKIFNSSIAKDRIVSIVCSHYGLTFEDINLKKRDRKLVYPRQLIMYFLKKYSTESLNTIGRVFNRDHTTVIHSVRLINDLIDTDDMIRKEVQDLQYLIETKEKKK